LGRPGPPRWNPRVREFSAISFLSPPLATCLLPPSPKHRRTSRRHRSPQEVHFTQPDDDLVPSNSRLGWFQLGTAWDAFILLRRLRATPFRDLKRGCKRLWEHVANSFPNVLHGLARSKPRSLRNWLPGCRLPARSAD